VKALIRLIKALKPSEQRRLALIMIGIAISAIFDVAGVASVVPFLTLVANPGAVGKFGFVAELRSLFGSLSDREFTTVVGLLSLGVIIAASALNAWVTWVQIRLTNMVGFTMSRRLLDAYLRQPHVTLVASNSAELGKNILSEVDRGVSGALTPALTLVSKATGVLFIGAFLFFVEPSLALLLLLLFAGVYGLVFLSVRRGLSRLGKAAVADNSQRFRIVAETFGALRELRIYGRLDRFVARFDGPASRYARATAASLLIGQLPKFVLEPLAFGSIIFVVIYALRSGSDVASILPLVGLFAFAGYRLMPAFQNIFTSFSALRFFLPSLNIILEGLQSPGETSASASSVLQTLHFTEKLEFSNVSFVYPDGCRVLDGASVTIEPRTTVGFVGRTGSGKTTLIMLILGLLKPTTGNIFVDGSELGGDRLAAWQRRIGYVPQDVFLIDGSVLENIALGVPAAEIDCGAVEAAARLAGIRDFVAGMPKGYETWVGERGSRLSGGQRQRIGIARALYHDPDVVIFDEATSGLDAETEEAVLSAIDGLASKRTLIIVSHNVGTLRRADIVHQIEKGRIVASGSVEHFAALVGAESAPASLKAVL
jgi:ABC-type multidrug transport system fused ATPase/permease subunit